MNTPRTEKVAEELGLTRVMTNRSLRFVSLFVIFAGCGTSASAICEKETADTIASVKYARRAYPAIVLTVESEVKKTVDDSLALIKTWSPKIKTDQISNLEKSIALWAGSASSGAPKEIGYANDLLSLCLLKSISSGGSSQSAGGANASINAASNSSQSQQTRDTQQRTDQSLQSAQPQSQQAQQQAQQTQQLAAQNQTRADQARQGQRRRHEPENEASHCIQPDFGGLYGGMKNTCDFKVWYTYCGYRPKENSWLTGMSCEKQSFGSDSVSPGRTSASHTKGVESIHWIACKEPAWTVDTEFVPGQGIKGRCYTVGGK